MKSRLRLFALDGRPAGEVPLPGIGNVGWPLSGRDSAPELFYSFRTFLAPDSVYRYDLKSGQSTVFRAPKVVLILIAVLVGVGLFLQRTRDAKLNNLICSQSCDQLTRRTKRDHASVVHYRHAVAQPRSFLHIVSR